MSPSVAMDSCPLPVGPIGHAMPHKFMPERPTEVYVYNKTKEAFLAFKVKVADSLLSRLVGLLGRRSLKPESGVWIIPCNSIHTVGMLFTIDVIFVDRKLRVVGLRELVRPFSITRPNFRAESVIELPAHAIVKSGTEIGDQLEIRRYQGEQRAAVDREEGQIFNHPTGCGHADRPHRV